MKKIYLIPALQVEEAEAQAALLQAVSLPISEETVSGDEALTKEDDSWDDWDED